MFLKYSTKVEYENNKRCICVFSYCIMCDVLEKSRMNVLM